MDQWGLTDAIFTWPGHHWPAVLRDIRTFISIFRQQKGSLQRELLNDIFTLQHPQLNVPQSSSVSLQDVCEQLVCWYTHLIMGLGKLGNENLPEVLIRGENNPWDRYSVVDAYHGLDFSWTTLCSSSSKVWPLELLRGGRRKKPQSQGKTVFTQKFCVV